MPEQSNIVSDNAAIAQISCVFDNTDYLVGGCVRDFLLGKSPTDFDILTFGNVWNKAVSVSEKLGSRPFWMDEARGIARTVSNDGTTIDVAGPKGSTLDEDLVNRDITINAIAINIVSREIHDPLKGLDDLNRHIIRVVSEKSFFDDPLRALRCLRFAAVLSFSIEEETLKLICKYAPGLKDVSPERIKQELVSALMNQRGAKIFNLMEQTGIRESLFPGYCDVYQGSNHRWPLNKHAIITAETADALIVQSDDILPGSSGLLATEIEDGLDRACLLRFAAFLHDVGKPSTRHDSDNGTIHFYGHASVGASIAAEISRNLKFSTAFSQKIAGLIELHMRVPDLACGGILSPRAMHRLLNKAQDFVPELLLLSLADAIATAKDPGYRGARTEIEEIIRRIWNYYTDVFLKNKRNPLVKGNDIMEVMGIGPGPEVGRLLSSVDDARAEGIVATRDDAIKYLKGANPKKD